MFDAGSSSPVAGTPDLLDKSHSKACAPVAAPVTAGQNDNPLAAEAAALDALARKVLARILQILAQSIHPPESSPPVQVLAGPAPATRPGISVIEAINEFLLRKARAQRSDRYLNQLRVALSSFAASLPPESGLTGQVPLSVERWLSRLSVKARTQRGYFSAVKTFLIYATRRGYLSPEVLAGLATVELPNNPPGPAPGIHSPEQVSRVLEHARSENLDIMRHLAVRYFCGIRSAETHRLREENILLAQGLVEVPAQKAKTKARRLVAIQPNLRAWLAVGGVLRPLCPETIRLCVRRSGVPWLQNVTRHSFVSYHYAQFESASKTAKEAGHTEQMLFSNYRALVTPEAAKQFWSIIPKL